MRRMFVMFLALSMLLVPSLGCGKKKPDPRSRPDFVDTSDPSKVGGMLPAPGQAPAGGPAQKAPAEKAP